MTTWHENLKNRKIHIKIMSVDAGCWMAVWLTDSVIGCTLCSWLCWGVARCKGKQKSRYGIRTNSQPPAVLGRCGQKLNAVGQFVTVSQLVGQSVNTAQALETFTFTINVYIGTFTHRLLCAKEWQQSQMCKPVKMVFVKKQKIATNRCSGWIKKST